MSTKLIKIKLDNFNARYDDEMNMLLKKSEYFVKSKITINEEEDIVIFEFNCDESRLLSNLKLSYKDKLILLLNIVKLNDIYDQLYFSLDPDNIIVDYDLNPKILYRDIKNTNITYVQQIKALVGGLLDERYKYQDYLQGGEDLLQNNGSKLFLKSNDVYQIEMTLIELINKTSDIIENDYSLIKNKKIKTNKIVKIIMILIIICSSIGLIFLSFKNHEIDKTNKLYSLYLNEDYSQVVIDSNKINVNKTSNEILFIVAKSVIYTQKLDEKIKQNLLAQVSINGDTNVLKYWVLLGQEKFDDAIDIAYTINDKNLLIYANLKYLDYVVNSSTLSSDKKEELRKSIESKLKELGVEVNTK